MTRTPNVVISRSRRCLPSNGRDFSSQQMQSMVVFNRLIGREGPGVRPQPPTSATGHITDNAQDVKTLGYSPKNP